MWMECFFSATVSDGFGAAARHSQAKPPAQQGPFLSYRHRGQRKVFASSPKHQFDLPSFHVETGRIGGQYHSGHGLFVSREVRRWIRESGDFDLWRAWLGMADVHWLIDWLMNWSLDCLIVWLIDWLIDWTKSVLFFILQTNVFYAFELFFENLFALLLW